MQMLRKSGQLSKAPKLTSFLKPFWNTMFELFQSQVPPRPQKKVNVWPFTSTWDLFWRSETEIVFEKVAHWVGQEPAPQWHPFLIPDETLTVPSVLQVPRLLPTIVPEVGTGVKEPSYWLPETEELLWTPVVLKVDPDLIKPTRPPQVVLERTKPQDRALAMFTCPDEIVETKAPATPVESIMPVKVALLMFTADVWATATKAAVSTNWLEEIEAEMDTFWTTTSWLATASSTDATELWSAEDPATLMLPVIWMFWNLVMLQKMEKAASVSWRPSI
ncbi:Hypothetical_protein [Hexamita inflata]|uniref:Hypothetical_protein n=1 Tax=Hexamita inflata TaxID=28002 RepID=A0AA86PPT3_9EUKA|nr:Hypothetical protein HINF_LOCUS26542 [Hexamita inflata]